MAHQRRRKGRVTVHLPCEPAVEGGEKSLLRRLPASQQQGAERRGERQGVEGRDDHRNGDRHRKLLEQPPRDAAGERHGDEYGQQHDCRGDDRRGHVAHGLQRRLAGFHAPFDIDLRGLDDDDGVVDHKADGQHQSQQRDDVDGKSQQREQREGADERHGDRHQGNDRRAPVLEEEEDDEDDEYEGDDERAEDVLHAGVDARGAVDDRGGLDAVRKPLREAFHRGLDLAAHSHGVAARLLVNDDHGRRVALVGRAYAVGLAAERHLGDVAQTDLFARGGGPHDDVGELRGGGDLRRHGHRIGVGHAVGSRLGAELPGRVDAALLLDGGRHLADGDAVVFQHVGPQPHPHGVFARAHDRDLAHAVDLQQLVLEIDVGVIREELPVVAAVAVQRVDHQESRHGLACRDPLPGDRRGEFGRGRRDVVLGEDGVEVGIGADVEGDLQDHRTVVGRGGLHVEHVADAHHGLGHGRRHGVVDRLGVGAVVGGRHLHDRRRDVGVLFDGQPHDRDQADEHDDDGQRNGENRARNKEFFHRTTVFRDACPPAPQRRPVQSSAQSGFRGSPLRRRAVSAARRPRPVRPGRVPRRCTTSRRRCRPG